MPGSIWLPTGPARYSGLEARRPLALVFYHVEKTGGSAVMKWLHKMANRPEPRLTSLFDFTQTSCFFALHGADYPGYRDAWDERRCSAPTAPDWRRAAVAVEFHAYSRRRYWNEVVSQLPVLRQRYAAANGTLLTVAMFREPTSHLLSVYRMWPPSRRTAAGKHAVPMDEWLPRAVGLQAGSLTLDTWPHVRKGFHNLRGCKSLPQGRERLASFDFVGVMDCMAGFLGSLCAAAGWPCEADRERMQLALRQALRFKPHGVSSGGVMMREARRYAAEGTANATVRAAIAIAARCDRAMYDDALVRIALPPPTTAGQAINRSLCAAAAYGRRPAG